MQCPECGWEVEGEARFCPHCGAETGAAGEPEAPAEAPPETTSYGAPAPPAEAAEPSAPAAYAPAPYPAAPASAPPPSVEEQKAGGAPLPPPMAPAPAWQPPAAAAPNSGPAPGANPAGGQLVITLGRWFSEAFSVLMSDLGNFVGLFLLTWVIAMGIGLVAGLISGVFMAIAPVLGVFIMAVLFIAFVPAPQFGQYAVLVHKLRSGLFNWSMYGPGFSRYFSVLMRMIGFQIVVALPMLIWALISAGTVGTLMLTVFRGGAPSDTEALGAGLGGMVVVGLVGLVAMIVQIWLSVRLAFGAGRIIIHDRSLGEALAESWSATSRQQMDVFMVGLALFGVALAAGIALGIVGAILGMVPVLGTIVMFVVNTVVGGLLNLWMMLVLWIAYRDNYGIGDAVAIPRS